MGREISRRTLLKGGVAGLAVGAGIGVHACLTTDDIELVRKDLSLPQWNADGFKVALLADFHLTRPWALSRALNALEIVAREKPDAIVLAGDFINAHMEHQIKNLRKFLRSVDDLGLPVVATLGNHDYQSGPRTVSREIKASGVKFLKDSVYDMDGVQFVGFDDVLFGNFNPATSRQARGARSVIGVIHEPDAADLAEPGMSLVLSGHSHGGQMCLPTGAPLHLPYGAKTYYAGFYPEAKTPVYVTRGVGTIGVAVRTYCRPEATILTLRGAV